MKKINRTDPIVDGIYSGCWWSFLFLIYGRSFSINLPWYGGVIGVLVSGAVGGVITMKWLQVISGKREDHAIPKDSDGI